MKRRLTGRETVVISSMLFGMFFGAGNMIFPAMLGVEAGCNVGFAFIGLFITAVGLPLLAVAALGLSRSSSLMEMSQRGGKGFGRLFSILLYLTIGPLFAIPRCAGTSFSIGAVALSPSIPRPIALAVFSFLFFSVVLLFSLYPGRIMDWIGKFLNPLFLLLLGVLVVVALARPITPVSLALPNGEYGTPLLSFLEGFLEGYNTLDALAGLAFGIVVVDAVRSIGIEEPSCIASSTVKSGVFSCLLMGIVYLLLSIVTAQSSAICQDCQNGSEVLGTIASYYFGDAGTWLLFAIVTLACLKTSIGLVTSCSEAFRSMFPNGPSYRTWSIVFAIVSFLIANLGLTTIVSYCVPVLMFLYPIAIVLIILSLCSRFFSHRRAVYTSTLAFTVFEALFDFAYAVCTIVPQDGKAFKVFWSISSIAFRIFPLFSVGLGWLFPAAVGLVVGLLLSMNEKPALC